MKEGLSVDEYSTLLDSAEAEESLGEVLTLDSGFLTSFPEIWEKRELT